MKFEKTQVNNFDNAIRGMRNPLASWHKSDSEFGMTPDIYDALDRGVVKWKEEWTEERGIDCMNFLKSNGYLSTDGDVIKYAFLGPNDMNLAVRLTKAGPEHRKFLRQIQVSVDITAPLYWWKEFDTYKVGTTANSTSTMHKLASTPITMDCFETDDFEDREVFKNTWDLLIKHCEDLRLAYNKSKNKVYWKELIRILPASWLQTRTVTLNYENLRSMYHQRNNHKLTEWHSFCKWCESLPHAEQFIILN